MRNILIVLVLIIFGSCQFERNKQSNKTNENIDSTQMYYNISLDNKKYLKQKHEAINKSLYYAKITNNDTLLAKVLYQKNLVHYSLAEYDSLLFFSDSLINYSKRNNLKAQLAKQFYLKGFYFNEVANNPDSAFINYNLSKNHFQYLKDTNWVGKNLLQMGIIQKNQGDFFGSKETITEALQYLIKEKDTSYIVSSYNALATNHRKLLNHEDAIKYYKKALAISSDKAEIIVLKNNLAATFIDNKDLCEALNILTDIVKDSILKEKPIEYARVLDNLGYTEWLLGKNESKLKLFDALDLRIENNDLRGQIASYTHLGEYSSNMNPIEAKFHFDSVIQISKRLKIPRAEKDVLKLLMSLEPNNVKIRDRYVYLKDSLYQKELQVKTQFAKYKYDDKLKQESILRLEKENAERKLESIKQRNQKTLYLGGMFLSISILGFVYYSFKQRSKRLKIENKTAKLEATYETEAELSRKLHDDFGGKLNHAMLLLQNGENNTEVLNIVGGLYNQSRDFSREINDIDTGPNFKNILFSMMGRYCGKTKLLVTGSTDVEWNKVSSLSKKTLYKVFQELMINMQKHSNASLVSVAFEQSIKKLKVDYADNGIGASTGAINLKNGLWNTEKRIQAIGGTIIFDSEEGNGFEAKIEIPN